MTRAILPSRRSGRRTDRRGTAAVELAIVLPFLMLFVAGIWEFGRMLELQQILSNAVREGARQAVGGHKSNAEVEAVVKQYLQDAAYNQAGLVIDDADIDVDVANETRGGEVYAAQQLDEVSVKVTVPFDRVRWATVDLRPLKFFFTDPDTMLESRTVWYAMADKPYPDPVDPPID